MTEAMSARKAGRLDGEFVVFLIGMRFNRWWKVNKWWQVVTAMPRMLAELGRQPELGFLGGDSWLGRTTVMVSYWRSMEHLMAYAKSTTGAHLPAWKAFNSTVGTNGDVGIWHESYQSKPGAYEAIYVNMPPFGLGKAGHTVDATGVYSRAATRLTAG